VLRGRSLVAGSENHGKRSHLLGSTGVPMLNKKNGIDVNQGVGEFYCGTGSKCRKKNSNCPTAKETKVPRLQKKRHINKTHDHRESGDQDESEVKVFLPHMVRHPRAQFGSNVPRIGGGRAFRWQLWRGE